MEIFKFVLQLHAFLQSKLLNNEVKITSLVNHIMQIF